MIDKWNEKKDGPLSEAALRKKISAQGFSVTRYVYPPGTNFPDHSHTVDKIDGVLSGRFQMEMKGESVVLEAGDCLFVPKGTIHSATVMGNEAVISLDATRHPGESQDPDRKSVVGILYGKLKGWILASARMTKVD